MTLPIPSIQIRQQFARIGIDADLGQYSMSQPKATMELKTTPTRMEVDAEDAVLHIDQSRSWDAINGGKPESFNNRIYSQMRDILLEGISHMVREGRQLAAVHNNRNAIADIARNAHLNIPQIQYYGHASVHNVDIEFSVPPMDVRVIEGGVELNTRPNRPEIEYHRGKLDIYMQQYSSLEIIPPQINEMI